MQKWKNKGGGLTLPTFEMYDKATEIKAVWYQRKNRQIDQCNRIETPEIDPHEYSSLIFGKGRKTIQWNKKILQIIQKNCTSKCKKNESRHKPYICHKINSK